MSCQQSKLYYLYNGSINSDTVVSTGVLQQEGPGFKSTGYLFSLISFYPQSKNRLIRLINDLCCHPQDWQQLR